jgi:hypothetical protein
MVIKYCSILNAFCLRLFLSKSWKESWLRNKIYKSCHALFIVSFVDFSSKKMMPAKHWLTNCFGNFFNTKRKEDTFWNRWMSRMHQQGLAEFAMFVSWLLFLSMSWLIWNRNSLWFRMFQLKIYKEKLLRTCLLTEDQLYLRKTWSNGD